jgi:hypothetical protein
VNVESHIAIIKPEDILVWYFCDPDSYREYPKALFFLLFFLIKKVKKKSRTKTNRHFFARKAPQETEWKNGGSHFSFTYPRHLQSWPYHSIVRYRCAIKLRQYSASTSISHEDMMNIRCGTMILCSNSCKSNVGQACASGLLLSAVLDRAIAASKNCLSQNHKVFGYFLAAKSD